MPTSIDMASAPRRCEAMQPRGFQNAIKLGCSFWNIFSIRSKTLLAPVPCTVPLPRADVTGLCFSLSVVRSLRFFQVHGDKRLQWSKG